jgi:hypothetical protein
VVFYGEIISTFAIKLFQLSKHRLIISYLMSMGTLKEFFMFQMG